MNFGQGIWQDVSRLHCGLTIIDECHIYKNVQKGQWKILVRMKEDRPRRYFWLLAMSGTQPTDSGTKGHSDKTHSVFEKYCPPGVGPKRNRKARARYLYGADTVRRKRRWLLGAGLLYDGEDNSSVCSSNNIGSLANNCQGSRKSVQRHGKSQAPFLGT